MGRSRQTPSKQKQPEAEQGGGWFSGALDWVQTGLDVAGMVPGVGNIADLANAGVSMARGDTAGAALSMAAMVPGAGQAVTAAKMARRASKVADVAKGVGKVAPDAAAKLTPRAARRKAMREAGIPTSKQPKGQRSVTAYDETGQVKAGRQYDYEVDGNKMSVQHSLTDRVENHGPHWEAGKVKPGGQVDGVGRPRLGGDKVKVDE